MDANPREGTPARDRMELLAIVIEAYEAETLSQFNAPTPQQMVQQMAEQKGISAGQLAEVIGGGAVGYRISIMSVVRFRLHRSSSCASYSGFPPII